MRSLHDALHESLGNKISDYVKVLANLSTLEDTYLLEDHVPEQLGLPIK